MAKRGPYTPRSGPLAGTQYTSYYRYQVARAQQMGYQGYGAQRKVEGLSIVQSMIDLAMQKGGLDRYQASRDIRQWYQGQSYKGRGARQGTLHSERQGGRKANAIAYAVDQGWFDSGDDAADYIDY